jgi:hypothetical protein
MALGMGRVRIVDKRAWSRIERELYAGREGRLCGIRTADGGSHQLVELLDGPLGGQRRWFRDDEIEALG